MKNNEVTIKDIAKKSKTSISTVSRALSNDYHNVSEETRKKILRIAQKMGYKRNELAANLRRRKTNTVGIIVPEMITPFYMDFIIYAQELLNKEGMRVILAQSHEDPKTEKENLKMMEDYRVDGILISVCHNQKNVSICKNLIEKGISLVFFDRIIKEISVPKVVVNNYMKSFFMVEHLIRSGKKNIVHLAGPSYIQYSSERKKAYRDALEKYKISLTPDYVIETGVEYKDGENSMETIIQKKIPFDAVFCFTEMVALGAKSRLHKHRYMIPDDVVICSISGTTLSTMVHPPITTVEVPIEQMAESSVQLLLEKLDNPSIENKTTELDAKLVLRGSTGDNI